MATKFAFIGRRHVGKSTATEIIQSFSEYSERLAFAEPLKNAFVDAFRTFQVAVGEEPDFTRQELDENKNYYRRQLEDFGTKFVRDRYREDFWVQLMKKSLDLRRGLEMTIIVDDCRFLNEAELLRSEGFTLVRLQRDDNERGISILKSIGFDYFLPMDIQSVLSEQMPSEVEVDRIQTHYTVTNTGNYEELKEALRDIYYS